MFGIARRELRTAALYDLLPALGVGAVMAVDLFQWTGNRQPTYAQGVSYLAVSVLGFVGLLLRRRWPLLILATIAIALKIWSDRFFPPGVQIPLSPIVVMLVLAYSTGAHTRGRKSWAGAVVLMLFFASLLWTQIETRQPNQPQGPIVMTIAWLIGKGVRHYRDLTAALLAQTLQLKEERDERARLAIVVERGRIAREMHDVIAHSVSVMVIQAAAERRVLGLQEHQTRDVLETIERTGRQALVELRRMLGVLRKADDPLLLAPQPGLGDLDNLLDQVRDAGLPVSLRVEGSRVALPTGTELSAYRIVQEALTNAIKHAGHANAEVTVRYLGDRLELEVADDGDGAAASMELNGGHGLVGMRERVGILGGSFQAKARESGGFLVTATLPLEAGTT